MGHRRNGRARLTDGKVPESHASLRGNAGEEISAIVIKV